MKNLLRSLLIGVLFLIPFSTTSFATAYDQLPESTDLTVKIDPANINDTIKVYYDMGLAFAVQDLVEGSYYYTDLEQEETPLQDSAITFLIDHLKENPVYLSISLYEVSDDWGGYTDGYAAFLVEMSQNDYESKMLPYLENLEDSTSLNNIEIYETNSASIAYVDGYLLAGSETEYIGNLIEFATCTSNCEDSLSSSSAFKNIESEFLPGSSIDLYVTSVAELIEETLGVDGEELLNTSFLGAIEEIGYSLKQSGSNYTLSSHIETNSSELKALGYDYSSTKKPTLYTKLPSGNVLFFHNSTTTQSSVGALQAMEGYEELVSEGVSEFNIDLDEILDTLDDEIAFVVQDTGEFLPSMTLLAELSSNESTIENLISLGSELLWTEMANEAKWISGNVVTDNKITMTDDPDIDVEITKSEVEIEGATLDQFTFEFTLKESQNPYAPHFSASDLTFVMTLGVTDGNLLISTNKNIANEYGEGLDLSSSLSSKIKSNIDTIIALDVTNIEAYFEGLFTNLKDIIPTEADNFSSAIWSVDTLAEPWGEIYITSKSTNSYSDTDLVVEFDLELLMSDFAAGQYDSLFESGSSSLEIVQNANTDFDDVEISEWYGDDVYYLTSHGVINGYPDGTYKPGNQVTRAEFITLLVRTLREKGLMSSTYWYWGGVTDYYSDTGEYDWYSEYIMQAIEVDIVNTDGGTFRPGEAITRAEAAQMLANTINFFGVQVYSTTAVNFYDVNSTHWFINAVEEVNNNGIMTGKSAGRFAPYDKLTRAESAKIIRTLIGNIDQF
ncbi:S-layer homology domain-containing protein [Candidatus Peregrinibacteria bacterium]|jgi:hypothetical protein|nr:S-layer homology domain-containing protein [Candidatus Peregrinibacteria bacterium]